MKKDKIIDFLSSRIEEIFDILSSVLVVVVGLVIGLIILLISNQTDPVLVPVFISIGLFVGFSILLINSIKRTAPKLLVPFLIFVGSLIGFIIMLISDQVVPVAFVVFISIGLSIGFITLLIKSQKIEFITLLVNKIEEKISKSPIGKWSDTLPVLVPILILVGLLIGLIISMVSNSEQAWSAFITILTFGFSSLRNFGDVLLRAAPIILTGLSVAFAFKTGLFNIGASGQFTMGAFIAVYIGVEFTSIPPLPRVLLAVVAAALFGALWAAIPGLLKAYRNVHEVISSIMTNYIGMFLVIFLITNSIFDQGRGTSTRLPNDSTLPTLGLEYIFTDGDRASHVNIGIFIAILAAILIYIILEKTTFGYELKACGFNKDAAKYAGINEKRNIVLSLMISGALAGLGGAVNYLGGTGLSMSVTDALAQEGFTGISVAFLGLSHPIAIIFSGTLVSYLFLGGARTQAFGFSIEIVHMVISIIIYFCAFVSIVKFFLLSRTKKQEMLKKEES